MKKTLVSSSVILALTFSSALLAEDGTASKFHGSIGTNIEIEQWTGTDVNGSDIDGGKVKYSLANGNFRHDALPGVDFGFYMAREFNHDESLFKANYQSVNDITEIYLNKNYGIENGNVGWGVKYAQESADKRSTPEAKVFGSYNINDFLEVHGYAMYHVELKLNSGKFNYWEIEPGLGFKIADNMGAWINFRLQQGTWIPNSGADKELETETIIKPGFWYSFGDLGTAVFAEIGTFEIVNDRTGANLWNEDYIKIGASANYPIAKDFRIFGELSYKTVDLEDGQGNKGDKALPFGVVGINYSF